MRIVRSLLYLAVAMTLIESIQFGLPLIKNSRTLSLVIMVLVAIYLVLFPKYRKQLREVLSQKCASLLLAFALTSLISCLSGPLPIDSRPISYLLLGLVSFFSLAVSGIDTTKLTKCLSLVVLFIGSLSFIGLLLPEIGEKLNYGLFHPVVADYIRYNFLRGRVFPAGLLFLSTIIPASLLTDPKATGFWRTVASASLAVGISGVLFSNYRSHVLTLFIGSILFAIIYRRKVNLKKYLASLVLITLSGLFLSASLLRVNIIDRLTLVDESDETSLETRWQYILMGWQLFRDSPITGVGLGNFGDRVPAIPNKFKINPYTQTPRWDAPEDLVLAGHPHSQWLLILSETGLIGFIPYVLLIFFFVKTDIQKIKGGKYDIYQKGLALSSWLYLIGGTFDALPINAQVYFLMIRGALATGRQPSHYIDYNRSLVDKVRFQSL